MPEGNYKVFIPNTSNAPINYACVWYGGAGSFEAGVPIPVRAGQTTSNIDFRLETRQRVIEGYVTDGSGAPIQGIRVSVYDAAAQTISQSIGATTDASGYYRVRYVPTGPVKIGFSAPAAGKSFVSEFYSDKALFADAEPLTVQPDQVLSGINAELAAAGTIKGRVTDSEGHGLYTRSSREIEVLKKSLCPLVVQKEKWKKRKVT